MKSTTYGLDRLGTSEQYIQEPKFDNFISLNPDLRTDFGHFLNYEKRLSEQCALRNIKYYCLANTEAVANLPIESINIFKNDSGYYSLLRKSSKGYEAAIINEFITTLKEAFDILGLSGKKNICFLYCGSSKLAAELAKTFNIYNTTLVINFFWDFIDSKNDYSYLSALAYNPSIIPLAMSHLHAEQINDITGFNYDFIPNPPPLYSDSEAVNLIKRNLCSKPTITKNIYLPSLLSDGKGLEQTIGIINDHPINSAVKLKIRDRTGILSTNKAALTNKNITLIKGDLSDNEIIEIYQASDFVLIPYEEKTFKYRTSGVLVDCLVHSCIPIVNEGTWLSDICKKYDFGIIIKRGASVGRLDDLYKRDIIELKQKTSVAAINYMATHSWSNMFDLFIREDNKSRNTLNRFNLGAVTRIVPLANKLFNDGDFYNAILAYLAAYNRYSSQSFIYSAYIAAKKVGYAGRISLSEITNFIDY